MALPLKPPVLPQLAKPGKGGMPEGDGWSFEQKYDGFRCIAFVDGDDVHLQSRNGKPLNRYFPELAFPPGQYVLDGEIVVRGPDGTEDFDSLGQRIHPAESRVKMLSEETPATYIAFDLLAVDGDVIMDRPFSERRKLLRKTAKKPVEVTTATTKPEEAEPWLQDTEGVIAKDVNAPYLAGERKGFFKVKRVRTIDAVVRGWRPGKEEGTVGALILGLYDGDGNMRDVGHVSGFRAKQKRELVDFLAPYETGERGSGDPSRWTGGRDLEYVLLRPELVVEIQFDHTSNGRIRHGAKLVRWRDDKDPQDCLVDQLDS